MTEPSFGFSFSEPLKKIPILEEQIPILEGQIPTFNNSGHTYIKEVKCNYTWIVHSFSLSPEATGEYLESPTFSAGDNAEYKWCLQLYPKGLTEKSKDYISLYLKLVPDRQRTAQAKFKFSVLNKMGERTNTRQGTPTEFHGVKKPNLGWSTFIPNATLLDKTLSLLPNDKLTILCEIREIRKRVKIPSHSGAMQVITPDCRLLDDLRLMFENQQLSDVTLSVGGKEFRTHKAILAARSPVFKAMFVHDMEEKKHNRIEIIDIDFEAVEEMLRFIYTGKVSNIEKNAVNLLVVADKYALETLKAMCTDFLCYNNLRIDNAIELLIAADLLRAQQLKEQTIDFINSHSKAIMETPEWRLMVQTYPNLLEELYSVATQ